MSRFSIALIALLGVAAAASCRTESEGHGNAATTVSDGRRGGGVLSVGIRGEPQTWNRLLATDRPSHAITDLLHAPLLRIHRLTQEIEPELAESWSFSEDGQSLVVRLRADVRFSDGEILDADDVQFTFRALHDPDVASPLVETARIDGQPLVPRVLDPLTIRFDLPRRTAVVERIFDSIPILPRHRLEESLSTRSFAAAYGTGAAVEEIVGLGPFRLERYRPGQRVVLQRNPYYWKTDKAGRRLPYLDRVVFEILPDANALMLRFRAGELDLLSPIAPEDFHRLGDRPDLELFDLGPGTAPERVWFNLNPESPSVSPTKRGWFTDVRFRRAVASAIDRSAIVEAVYLGLASPAAGPVSPSSRWWNDALRPLRHDPDAARRWLEQASFTWSETGELLGPEGQPVQFNLITNSDNPRRLKTAALLQEDLSQIGMTVNVVPLDFGALIERISRSFDYDACLLSVELTDPDPSAEMPLWLSRSPLHVWQPAQESPATTWEARIDGLMERQLSAIDHAERKRHFDEVQAILHERLPVIDLVVPHVLVGASRRVMDFEPAPVWHPTLWNLERLRDSP